MQFVLVLLILSSGAFSKKIPSHLADSWYAMLKPHEEVCIKETQVDPDLAKYIFSGDHIPEERHIPCYLECLGRKLKFSLPNGEFDEELITKKMDHVTKELIDKCAVNYHSEKNPCVKNYEVVICLFEASEN